MLGTNARKPDRTTACEIECQLLSRADPRHQSLCVGLEDVSCPIIGKNYVKKDVPDAKRETSASSKYLPSRVINWIQELRGVLINKGGRELIRGERLVRREVSQIATSLSWCPNAEVIACSFSDDSVRLFDLRKRIWRRPRLEHVFQKDIRVFFF